MFDAEENLIPDKGFEVKIGFVGKIVGYFEVTSATTLTVNVEALI